MSNEYIVCNFRKFEELEAEVKWQLIVSLTWSSAVAERPRDVQSRPVIIIWLTKYVYVVQVCSAQDISPHAKLQGAAIWQT